MCSECRHTPCHPSCPNAPEPAVLLGCDICGMDICEGDDYYDLLGDIYCEECVRNSRKTAAKED